MRAEDRHFLNKALPGAHEIKDDAEWERECKDRIGDAMDEGYIRPGSVGDIFIQWAASYPQHLQPGTPEYEAEEERKS